MSLIRPCNDEASTLSGLEEMWMIPSELNFVDKPDNHKQGLTRLQ